MRFTGGNVQRMQSLFLGRYSRHVPLRQDPRDNPGCGEETVSHGWPLDQRGFLSAELEEVSVERVVQMNRGRWMGELFLVVHAEESH